MGNGRVINLSLSQSLMAAFWLHHMPHALPVKLPRLLQALESLDPSKYTIPEPFPYREARQLFKGKLHADECSDGVPATKSLGWGTVAAVDW